MAHLVSGLFKNSKNAGEAVSELKEKGYTKNVSVIAKDWDDTEVKAHEVKGNSGVEGGIIGAAVGGLAGLIVGTSAVFFPGIGTLLVAGPVTAMVAAAGAFTGGLVGFLVDIGIPENQAKIYEDAIRRGEVLVAVSVDHKDEAKVRSILNSYRPVATDIKHREFASM